MFYVIEMQTGNEGAGIVTAFADKADALEKFHEAAKYAVKSEVPVHTVMCVNENGFPVVDTIVYEHK